MKNKHRKAANFSDTEWYLCIAYTEIEKEKDGACGHSDDFDYGMIEGLERAQNVIKEMLDIATLGDIDWEEIKRLEKENPSK